MVDRPWKAEERAVAKLLGFKRMPNIGSGNPDINAGPWAVEVKARKVLPDWFHEAHAQARRNAGSSTPLVVFSERKQGVKTIRYVSMEMEDFLEWYGPGGWCRPTIAQGHKEEKP